MNINNLLRLLSEERGIDHIMDSLKGKVPQETLDVLASKVKKGKFDNEAMAILNGIQDAADGAKAKYLAFHAGLVYSILKKLKLGNSNFNANGVISDYLKSTGEPKKFWVAKYAESNNKPTRMSKEEEKFNTTGLKGARTKDLGDCIAILPKNFKKFSAKYDTKGIDMEKSHKELKDLSADLAKRDTSGERGADVNHWCVAASSDNWFKNYKNGWRKGEFVIFVKKNKDGSPDWNNRWLAHFTDHIDPKYGPEIEVADKLDRHVPIKELPKGAADFFQKMIDQKEKKGQRPDENEEIARRLNTKDERELIKTGDNENARKLIEYVYSVVRKAKKYKASQIISYLKKELKERGVNNFVELTDDRNLFFNKSFAGVRGSVKIHDGKAEFVLGPFRFSSATRTEVLKTLDKCVADPSVIEKIIDENLEKTKIEKATTYGAEGYKFGRPTQNMIRSLGGNTKIMRDYFHRHKDDVNNLQVGTITIPSPNSVKNENNIKVEIGTYQDPDKVAIAYDYHYKILGSKKDPETLEKLKDSINEIFKQKGNQRAI